MKRFFAVIAAACSFAAQAEDIVAAVSPAVPGTRFEFRYDQQAVKGGQSSTVTWKEEVKEVTSSQVTTTRNIYTSEGNPIKYGKMRFMPSLPVISLPLKTGEKRGVTPFHYLTSSGTRIDVKGGTVTTGQWETMQVGSGKTLPVVRLKAVLHYTNAANGAEGDIIYSVLYAPSLARIAYYDREDWGRGELWAKWSETLTDYTRRHPFHPRSSAGMFLYFLASTQELLRYVFDIVERRVDLACHRRFEEDLRYPVFHDEDGGY
jgi:hypothetical protein